MPQNPPRTLPSDIKCFLYQSFSLITLFLSVLALLISPLIANAENCEHHRVKWVIDGDTLVIDTGQRVRLIGVDTPEKGDRRRDVEYYAIEALRFLREAVEGKMVCLRKDPLHTEHIDRYGRLLRYLYLGERFINLELVQKGYGYVFTSYPFTYIETFKKAEAEARAWSLGIWNNDKRCKWQNRLIEEMKLADTCGKEKTICPWQALKFLNKKTKVRMFVHRVMEGREYIFLDSERDYKSPLNLRVLLPKGKVHDPYELLGKTIDVTGRVVLYKDRPELRAEEIRPLR